MKKCVGAAGRVAWHVCPRLGMRSVPVLPTRPHLHPGGRVSTRFFVFGGCRRPASAHLFARPQAVGDSGPDLSETDADRRRFWLVTVQLCQQKEEVCSWALALRCSLGRFGASF